MYSLGVFQAFNLAQPGRRREANIVTGSHFSLIHAMCFRALKNHTYKVFKLLLIQPGTA
jgi:hypothetical protein